MKRCDPTNAPKSGPIDLRVLPDEEAAAREAAGEFARVVRATVTERGVASVALAGGSTPQRLYRLLAGDPPGETGREAIPWDRVEIFWGDERCVPPDHAQSNYGMARRLLLERVSVPEERIHRIRAEDPDPDRAARHYEAELRSVLRAGRRTPRFDLVLLGLGTDGHVASLFPGSAAARARSRLVVAVPPREAPRLSEAPGRIGRITLTLPVIRAAALVVVLATGAAKAAIVAAVLRGRRGTRAARWRPLPARPRDVPARRILPHRGRLVWILERAAAGRL